MRLGTLDLPRGSRAAVQDGGRWVALDASDVGALVADPRWRTGAEAALADIDRPRVTGARMLCPVPAPSKIFCCGLNYRDHIAETGHETPEYPTLFAKFAGALTDPDADIEIIGSAKVDWEAELAVVVGAETFRADRDRAAAGILGYTVANDVSARDWQARTLQWLAGKTFDRATPVGPLVVTADEFDPAAGAAIGAKVGRDTMQLSDTSQLLFDAVDLVAYISQFSRLVPGDLILTGTPGGVGLGRTPQRFLRDGEQVVVWIDGIGELRNRFHLVPGAEGGAA